MALVALVVLVVLSVWVSSQRTSEPASLAPRTETAVADESVPVDLVAEDGTREAATAPPVDVAPSSKARGQNVKKVVVPKTFRVRGRVVDSKGATVPGLAIARNDARDQTLGVSAFDGTFEFELKADYARLATIADEWVTIYLGVFDHTQAAREVLVVVAPGIKLAGHVVDAMEGSGGEGVGGARLDIQVLYGSLPGFPLPLHASEAARFETQAGENGAFDFGEAPALGQLRIQTQAEGFRIDQQPVPALSTSDLTIGLKRNPSGRAAASGFVLHVDRSPASGASVHLGGQLVEVDELGAFRLELPERVEDGVSLVATKAGFQAAILPDFDARVEAAAGHPAPVTLVLGGPALSIAGKLVDSDERPLALWKIALVDATPLTQMVWPSATVERMTSGSDAGVTGEDGSFQFGGLSARAYSLRAYATGTLVSLTSEPIQAGKQDVVLRLPADSIVPELTGRVVARDGSPLARVFVNVRYVTESSHVGSVTSQGSSTQTADDGSWTLQKVPRRHVTIFAGGDDIMPTEVKIEELELTKPIVITAMRRCHFRIEGVAKDQGVARFKVQDSRGTTLTMMQFQGSGAANFDWYWFVDGATDALAVSEAAAKIVFLDHTNKELGSRDVQLSPHEVTVVRY